MFEITRGKVQGMWLSEGARTVLTNLVAEAGGKKTGRNLHVHLGEPLVLEVVDGKPLVLPQQTELVFCQEPKSWRANSTVCMVFSGKTCLYKILGSMEYAKPSAAPAIGRRTTGPRGPLMDSTRA